MSLACYIAGDPTPTVAWTKVGGKVLIYSCKVKSAHETSGPHLGAYPGLRSMKRLGVLLLPGWDASPSQAPHSISSGFPDSSPVPIYTPGWREAL